MECTHWVGPFFFQTLALLGFCFEKISIFTPLDPHFGDIFVPKLRLKTYLFVTMLTTIQEEKWQHFPSILWFKVSLYSRFSHKALDSYVSLLLFDHAVQQYLSTWPGGMREAIK